MSKITNESQENLNSAIDLMEDLGYSIFKSSCDDPSKIKHTTTITKNDIVQCQNCASYEELLKCC